MASYKNTDKKTVLAAIENSQGIISVIAKRLGCAWDTAESLCNRWEETREALNNEREFVLDMAESVIFKSINNGSEANAKWLLALKGKHRGYDPQATLKVDNGEPLNIRFDGLSRDEIAAADNVEIGGTSEESSTDDQ
jgi:hypothetical protein